MEAEHGAHQCRHGRSGPAAVTLYVTQTVGSGAASAENGVSGEIPDLAGILERLEALEARPEPLVPDVRALVDAAATEAEARVRAEMLERVAAAVREMQDELRANLDEALERLQPAAARAPAASAAPSPAAALPEPMAPVALPAVAHAPAWALRDLLSRSGDALPPEDKTVGAVAAQTPAEAEAQPNDEPQARTPEEALSAVRDEIEAEAFSILSRLCSDQIAWEAAMRARNGSSVALQLFQEEAGVLGIDPGALVERIISRRQANERRTMAVRAAYLRAWQAPDAAAAEQRRREMMEAGDG